MRVAFYNHMFGCNSKSLPEFLYVHLLHAAQKYHLLERFSKIHETIKTVSNVNADVVGISEIVGEKQRKMLIEDLKTKGFTHFHTGTGHGLGKNYGGNVESLLATKEKSEVFYAPLFFAPSRTGFGGGIVGVFLPLKNLYVLLVHLPLARIYRRTFASFKKQLKTVMNHIEKMIQDNPKLKLIMMGDFNMTFEDLKKEDRRFERYFKRIACEGATCTTAAFVRLFYQKDLDHIFGYNIEAKDSGLVDGVSDHKLIWVEV